MMIILWIITSLVMFSVIVLLHEYGHFKTARMFWVKVYEFGLGMPPRAKKVKTDKHWTEYSLNWLPLGWFVRLKWENITTFLIFDKNKKHIKSKELENAILSNTELFDKDWKQISQEELDMILEKIKDNYASDSLITKSWFQQSVVMLAWVFMNFLLAWVVLSILFFIWVKPLGVNSKIQTNLDLKLIPTLEQSLEKWYLQQKEWLIFSKTDKSLINIENWVIKEIISWENTYKINEFAKLVEVLNNNIWKQITVSWYALTQECSDKNNCEQNIFTQNVIVPETWKLWVYIWENIQLNSDFEYKYWVLDSMKYAAKETYSQSVLTLQSLKYLLVKVVSPKTPQDRKEAINEMSWPIWIVSFITKSINYWVEFVVLIWVIISINLWVFNLLPIPALDGWRFLLISVNTIVKKIFWVKIISDWLESFIHVAFFALLIILSFFIAYNDITKLIN